MKWLIPLLSLAFAAMMLLSAHSSLANERDMASKAGVTCKYKNIKASGATQYEARNAVADQCFDKYMDAFEFQRGSMPSDNQAQDIIESCVNQTVCSS